MFVLAPASSSGVEAPSSDGQTSLEAELESLPADDHQTNERDDNAEEELEQIGKLLRNSSKQGTLRNFPTRRFVRIRLIGLPLARQNFWLIGCCRIEYRADQSSKYVCIRS